MFPMGRRNDSFTAAMLLAAAAGMSSREFADTIMPPRMLPPKPRGGTAQFQGSKRKAREAKRRRKF